QGCLEKAGCFDDATRGAGMNTAIAAAALASYGRHMSIEDALRLGANAIGSDTDTISSMAGAGLGAAKGGEPTWAIQDRRYLGSEAIRLAEIAAGSTASSFPYPDLADWSPPGDGDAVRSRDGSLWLAGLGKAEAVGETWRNSEADWQWLRLAFGQSILA